MHKYSKKEIQYSQPLNYRKINNSSFTGLLDSHINTSAHEEVPPDPQTLKPIKLCPYTQHPLHSHAQLHTKGTPLQTTFSEAHHLHNVSINRWTPQPIPFFDTPYLELQTSPASPIITVEPQTGTQGHIALNVTTPSLLEDISPQCT